MNRPHRKDYGDGAEELELYTGHLDAWAAHTRKFYERRKQLPQPSQARSMAGLFARFLTAAGPSLRA